jgi:rod shape-determining protein MreC
MGSWAAICQPGAVQRENKELKRKELEGANWLLRQQHLEQENQHLRELLDMRSEAAGEVGHAGRNSVHRARSLLAQGHRRQGRPAGIVAGQAVVDDPACSAR